MQPFLRGTEAGLACRRELLKLCYLVEQEACPGQSPAAPAAGAGAAADAPAEVEALEQLQQVVPRRRRRRHRQHPASGQPSSARPVRHGTELRKAGACLPEGLDVLDGGLLPDEQHRLRLRAEPHQQRGRRRQRRARAPQHALRLHLRHPRRHHRFVATRMQAGARRANRALAR